MGLLLLAGRPAAAQALLPPEAAEALRAGQRLAAEALITYERHFPDQRLWAQALDAGRAAAAVAPDHPAPHRFLAQAYGHVSWYARAWDSWQRFLEVGGTLDATASRQLVEVAFWLGIQAFDAGWTEPARVYLETVLGLDPENVGAHERLARLALDRGAPEEAQAHLALLDEALVPDLPALRELADLQARHGPAATELFLAGRAAQAAGDQLTALERYADATEVSATFVEAWRGRAAAAAALGRPGDATSAWQRVLQLAPGDAAAAAGFARARDQLAFGVAAQRAFESGFAAYRAGNVAGARVQFQTAVAQNPEYVDALAWLGRIAAETGDLTTAATRYRGALALAPNRTDLSQALAQVEGQLATAQAAQAAQAEAQAAAQAAAQATAQATAQAAAQAPAPTPAPTPEPTPQPTPTPAAPEPDPEPTPPAPSPEPEPAPVPTAPPPTPSASWIVAVDHAMVHRASSTGGTGAITFVDTSHLRTNLEAFENGTLHVRLEVRSKPSSEPVDYRLCIVQPDITVAPACTAAGALEVTDEGTATLAQQVTSLAGGTLGWQRGVHQVMLVLRRPDGTPIDDRLLPGASTLTPIETADYFPMQVRVTGILVAAGGTFPGWP